MIGSMRRAIFQHLASAATILFVALWIAACGSSEPGSVAVIKVDGSPITRATFSHWMSVLVAGDNLEHVGHRAPKGLVSDPPDYRACKAAVESIGPPKGALAAPLDSKRIGLQCRQLYEGVKEQTAGFLIQALWSAKEAARSGVVVSGREVEQGLAGAKAEYETRASFEAFLADNGRTVADERFLIRQSLLAERLEAQRRRVLGRTVKGKEALGRALLESYAESIKKRSARTECSRGYVIRECSTYRQTGSAEPSPAVVLEQIAASRRTKARR
jgi:hypothetical protein